MPYASVISPLGSPIHIAQAKAHLRVDGTDEDATIKSMIDSAVQAVQAKTHQQLLHARYRLTLDGFQCVIRLPHSPVVSVLSVQYIDLDGALKTVDPSDYVVNMDATPATITQAFGKVWPIAMWQAASVFVTYEAGYASPVSVSVGTRNLTVSGPYAFTEGQRVTFSNSGGALPAPLSEDAAYTVATASGSIYTFADSTGTAVTFSDAGAGRSFIGAIPAPLISWVLLRIGSLFESREEAAQSQRGKIETLPFVDGLLTPYLVMEY